MSVILAILLEELKNTTLPKRALHTQLELASRLKATDWDVLKTEAIDMSEDFVWFDDSPMASELLALEQAGKSNSLYSMDTRDNPNALCER